MPIYEFYCDACNVIFNFFSRRINTTSIPSCPRCGKEQLTRQLSTFATIGKDGEGGEEMPEGLDEAGMEKAVASLMREAEGMNEDDPRQMAKLMRRFSRETGVNLGESMEETLARMEAGEDPEQLEKEMGDALGEGDFSFERLKKKGFTDRKRPYHDDKLYDL